MLVRSPVRGQTKWFLRRLPVDQRSHPLEGSPKRGRPVLDGWVSRLGCFGRGVLALSWTNFLHHVGPFFKTIGPHGDEVPRPRQPALAPIVIPVGGFPCPWSHFLLLFFIWENTKKYQVLVRWLTWPTRRHLQV